MQSDVFLRTTAVFKVPEVEGANELEIGLSARDGLMSSLEAFDMAVDVETVVPVAYDEGDGQTKDFTVFDGFKRSELRNAIAGAELWVLHVDGTDQSNQSYIFATKEDAAKALERRFDSEWVHHFDNGDRVSRFCCPSASDGTAAYIFGKNGREVNLRISRADTTQF